MLRPETNRETTLIDDFADRHIAFEGCFNFRDIGAIRPPTGAASSGVGTSAPVDRTA